MAGGQVRIEEMYAFVMTDPVDNTEGVVGFYSTEGWLPMVGADPARVEQLRPLAQDIASQHDTSIKILRFTVREEIGVIAP